MADKTRLREGAWYRKVYCKTETHALRRSVKHMNDGRGMSMERLRGCKRSREHFKEDYRSGFSRSHELKPPRAAGAQTNSTQRR